MIDQLTILKTLVSKSLGKSISVIAQRKCSSTSGLVASHGCNTGFPAFSAIAHILKNQEELDELHSMCTEAARSARVPSAVV